MTTVLHQFLWLAMAKWSVLPGHFEIGAPDQFQLGANTFNRCLPLRGSALLLQPKKTGQLKTQPACTHKAVITALIELRRGVRLDH